MDHRNSGKAYHQVELQGVAKYTRQFLLAAAPKTGISKNDLFNNGYGGLVTIVFGMVFFLTFAYYSYTNTVYNSTAQFLVPKDGNQKGMHCDPVPVSLTNSYSMDSQGRWNSNTRYSLGDSLYGLEMVNAQYSKDRPYDIAMTAFANDLKDKSIIASESDFAWNIVFSGSYAVVAETEGNGKSTFYIDADSRLMYDVPISTSGFSAATGSCIPKSYDFAYDGKSFALELSKNFSNYEDFDFCPQLSNIGDFEKSLGTTSYDSDKADHATFSFYFDAASITTAIAVNYKISTLDSLTPVPSLDYEDILSAYIDDFYAPMEPVYCFNAMKFGHAEFKDLCLIKFGNMFAFPITSHFGAFNSTTQSPDACGCPSTADSDCNHYDITVGLVFIPSMKPWNVDVSDTSVVPDGNTALFNDVQGDDANSNSTSYNSYDDFQGDDANSNSTSHNNYDDFQGDDANSNSTSHNNYDDFQVDDALSTSYSSNDYYDGNSSIPYYTYSLTDDYHTSREYIILLNMIKNVLQFHESAQNSSQKINEYLRPLLTVSTMATYHARPGEYLDDTTTLDQLKVIFTNICPECFVFSFELYDEDHFYSGPTINKGGQVLANMNCQNSFYKQEVLNVLINNPPSSTTQDYMVCTDDQPTAVSTGISNAYASAQLYSATLLIVLVWLVTKFHNQVNRGPPINSTEEQEVLIRNAIAVVLAAVLSKEHLFTDEERKALTERLSVVGITDPQTYTLTHSAKKDEIALDSDDKVSGKYELPTRSPSGNTSPEPLEAVIIRM